MISSFYNDYLYKKFKPKSDILETLLENTEHQLVKINEIPSLYNVSIPTQDDVWICGRVCCETGNGNGKLTEHNTILQGSYVCSNSHSIPLNLSTCPEYSLFPGQIILANGRNPDGKKFICKQIIEPLYVSDKKLNRKEELERHNLITSINVNLDCDEELNIISAAGPFMINGTIQYNNLMSLIEVAKSKNAHILILQGPFVDCSNEVITTGNIQFTYEELLQNIFDELSSKLNNSRIQVIIQPSLNDVTQDPVYPVHPFYAPPQFLKQNSNFHFVQEPCMFKINEYVFAVTSTDIIKDLIVLSSYKTASSDKISRNFVHLLRQRSFYPIYPPPDHVTIDFEAWAKYAIIETNPKIFIAVSDLANFNKEVNNCVCLNPGRLVKGTSTGTYSQIVFAKAAPKKIETDDTLEQYMMDTSSSQTNTQANNSDFKILVTFNKI